MQIFLVSLLHQKSTPRVFELDHCDERVSGVVGQLAIVRVARQFVLVYQVVDLVDVCTRLISSHSDDQSHIRLNWFPSGNHAISSAD